MSSVIDLWARTLGQTSEEFLQAVLSHVDHALMHEDRYFADIDERDDDDSSYEIRESTVSFSSFVPNATEGDRSRTDATYMKLEGLADEDGAPLPDAWFRVVIEPIDRPVERND